MFAKKEEISHLLSWVLVYYLPCKLLMFNYQTQSIINHLNNISATTISNRFHSWITLHLKTACQKSIVVLISTSKAWVGPWLEPENCGQFVLYNWKLKRSDSGLEFSLHLYGVCCQTCFYLNICPFLHVREMLLSWCFHSIYIFGHSWGRIIGGFVLGTILLWNIANVGSFQHNSMNFLHVWVEGRHF